MTPARFFGGMILSGFAASTGTDLEAQPAWTEDRLHLALACELGDTVEAFVVTTAPEGPLDLLGAQGAIVRQGDRALTIIEGDRTFQFSNNQLIAVEAGEVTRSDCLDIRPEVDRLASLIADQEADRTAAVARAAEQTAETLRARLSVREAELEDATQIQQRLRADMERVTDERDAAHAEEIADLRSEIDRRDALIDELSRDRVIARSGLPPGRIEAALAPGGFDQGVLEALISASDMPAEARDEVSAEIAAVTDETAAPDVIKLQARIRNAVLDGAAAAAVEAATLSQEVDALREALAAEKSQRDGIGKRLGDQIQNLQTRLAAAVLAQEPLRAERDAAAVEASTAAAERASLEERLAELILTQAELSNETATLEAERQDLETRLSAALAARYRAERTVEDALAEARRGEALLATATAQLSEEEELSLEAQREVELLNEQVRQLRDQVGSLQTLLDMSEEVDRTADVQVNALGAQLNTALARAANAERRTREAEEEARRLAEAEAEAEAARLAAEARIDDLEARLAVMILSEVELIEIPRNARVAAAEEMRAARPGQAALEEEVPVAAPPEDVPADYMEMVERLREIVPTRPDDLEGWQLLARHEAALGNYPAARTAQERVIDIRGGDAHLPDLERLLDLMVAATAGVVSPEAEELASRILVLEEGNLAARYYIGLLYAQTDRPDIAFRLWRTVIAEGPSESAHVRLARDQIEEAAFRAGEDYTLPPLDAYAATGSLHEGFRIAVQRCWNVDAGSEAARIAVTVGFSLTPEGRVEGDTRLVSASDGPESAQRAAYEAARRAVLRCQSEGYDLPEEKYDQWRDMTMTFDPRQR